MKTSLLDKYLKDAATPQEIIENAEVVDSEVSANESEVENEFISADGETTLLDKYLVDEKSDASTDVEPPQSTASIDDIDYRTIYLAKVKLGEWKPVDGENQIDWNEDNFKKIADAQKTSAPKEEYENYSNEDREWLKKQKEWLGYFEAMDCGNLKESKDLITYYEIKERGVSKETVEKKLNALEEDEIITEAKTIRSKIVGETKKSIEDRESFISEQKKKEEDAWNSYQTSFIGEGEKLKVNKEASLKKIEMIKSGELNKKFWDGIYNPETAHKIIDFLSDPNKYEEKIKKTENNKLVVEQLSKKNIASIPANKNNTIKIKF